MLGPIYSIKQHENILSMRKNGTMRKDRTDSKAYRNGKNSCPKPFPFFVGKRERNIIDLRLLKLKIQAYPTHILYLLVNGKILF
jgi:hypothetical protein